MDKIAIIRIRGIRNMKPRLMRTLEMLRLHRPNHCVIYEDTPQVMGMIQVIKDYVAYGSVSQEILQKLIEKRGEKGENRVDAKKTLEEMAKGKKMKDLIDPVFRLHPPRKGYKDIKSAYPVGDLGKRPDMDSLIKRMM